MSRRKNKDLEQEVIAAALVIQGEGNSNQGESKSEIDEVKALLRKHLLEQLREQQAAKINREHLRQQVQLAIKMEQQAREARKRACSHLRPNNTVLISGQYLTNGELLLICPRCQSTWRSIDELPERIRTMIDQSVLGDARG